MLNLLLGVFFSIFSIAQQSKNHKHLNENQIDWISIQKRILTVTPLPYNPPEAGFRIRIFSFIIDKKFKKLVVCFLVLNMIVLATYQNENDGILTQVAKIVTIFITIFYVSECFLKVISFGFKGYFSSFGFQIEFVILLGYLADFYYNFWEIPTKEEEGDQNAIIVIKCFKLLVIIRFLGFLKTLKSIIHSLAFSIRRISNFFYLILIVCLIYSAIGNNLFSSVATGTIINDRLNFASVPSGMLILFKCITCDNWIDIMYDIANGECEFCGFSKIY